MTENLRVARTRNVELLREFLATEGMWEEMTEDGAGPVEDYNPNLESTYALVLRAEDAVTGFVLARPLSHSILDVRFAIPNMDPAARRLGREACGRLLREYPKLESRIPAPDKGLLRFSQQIGFKREGIARAALLRGGELLDEVHVGLAQP